MNYGASLLFPLVFAVTSCSPNTLEPEITRLPAPPGALTGESGDTLTPLADALIRSGAKNSNSGTSQSITVKTSGGDTSRAIIAFDQASIAAAVGSASLTSAFLELSIKESGTDPAGSDIDVHRVLKPWTEAGVTWRCGQDLNISNGVPDCPTTGWTMSGAATDAFVPTRTARVHLSPGQTGVARFDVTGDVQGFLAGQGNNGWIVNAATAPSRAVVWSREAGLKPQLMLLITETDTTTPSVPQDFSPPPDSTRTVSVPGEPAVRYHRHILGIVFDDSTSGTTVNGVLRKYHATIVGGLPEWGTRGAYIVQVPDTVSTYQGLQDLLSQIAGELGVDFGFEIAWRDKVVPRGRYPEDGTGSQRIDWTNPGPSSTTAPWQSIRAPLAWGCENGMYGSTRISVGVIDWTFDAAHQDLASSTKTLVEAPLNTMAPSLYLGDPGAGRIYRSHGTAVAGILAAEGDNSGGIAGMLWGADLRLYAQGRGTDETQASPIFLASKVFPDARINGVRVLVTSLGAGLDQPHNVRLIRDELRRYLQANNGSLIVIATGNDGRQIPVATALGTTHPNFTALDRAALELYPEFPRQIIFVTGTDNQGVFRPGGNIWLGATWIAAPAGDITTLARTSEYPGGIDLRSGTSYAAPFVAGAAAQLLAMDPTLSGSRVGDYLFNGATLPQVDPQTGSSTSPASIGYHGIYQLDAYGPLNLLSRERRGTPICGLEAWASSTFDPNTSSNTWSVFIGRDSSESITLPQPGIGVSVAQGGRQLAAQGGFSAQLYRLIDGTWQPQPSDPAYQEIHYLERDTAYIRFTGSTEESRFNDIFVRIGSHYPGRSRAEQHVTAAGASGAFSRLNLHSIAPTGDWVLFNWELVRGEDCTTEAITQTNTLYAVPLRGGGAQTVLSSTSDDLCPGTGLSPNYEGPGPMAWRNDGNAFVATSSMAQGIRLRRFSVSGSTIAQVGGAVDQGNSGDQFLMMSAASWDPEGSRLRMTEQILSAEGAVLGCNLVLRRASTLGVLSSTPASPARCGEQRSVQPAVRLATGTRAGSITGER